MDTARASCPPRRRWPGAVVLGAAALLGIGWLAHLDFSRKISTDVLDLLPATERSPEIETVRALASDAEARVMLFILTDQAGAPAPPAAAHRFADALAHEPAFDQAVSLDDTGPRDAIGKALFAQRFSLLFPLWLQERAAAYAAAGSAAGPYSAWLAQNAAVRLNQFLATPAALPFQDALPADPLLLMPGVLERLQGGLRLVEPPSDSPASAPARVWARIAASPLTEAGQQPVFAAIARAVAATRAEFPGLEVADTGVNRFAAASKARIQHELGWINTLSIAAVLSVALICIRGAQRSLHLIPPVLLAVLGAWVATTMAFARIHILVFVVGSLLTGVAIDYGFYLYTQMPAGATEDYWTKVRRLRKPLLSSCFTTVAGFALLLASDLPLLRQLGVFVAAGLLCALGGAIVYFSLLGDGCLEPREFAALRSLSPRGRTNVRRGLICLWLAALPGLARITWHDDIRELEVPSPAVQSNDTRVRAQFGETANQTVYLTQGHSLAEARAALERFDAWLVAANPQAAIANLGAVIPTAAEADAAWRFAQDHPEFPGQMRAALNEAGFDPAAFAPFFQAYQHYTAEQAAGDLNTAVTALRASMGGPLSLLLHVGQPLTWFVTLASNAPDAAPPPETDTLKASQLESLNRIFAQYRRSALRLSLTGLAIVGLGVFLAYGIRDGLRVFAIPCGACLGIFGLFGWIGLPLNLFYLLGAFLGVCLTHNYSIFSVTSAYRQEAPPVSVRLSALCTAASFGVLALSGIPVVHALGETVALMVLAALVTIEFEHFNAIARKS